MTTPMLGVQRVTTIPQAGGPDGGWSLHTFPPNGCRPSIAVMVEPRTSGVPEGLRVLVFSSNATTRREVTSALGPHPHPQLPEINYVEVATAAAVIALLDAGNLNLAILDGESTPVGGMGLAKQLKDEVDRCPPILVLTGRPDDAWLARWSRAEAAVPHPIDPTMMAAAAIALLRRRAVA